MNAANVRRAIAHRALPLGHVPQVRYQPGGRSVLRESIRLIDWGNVAPGDGLVVALGETPPLTRVLALADAFFAGRLNGYRVRVDGGAGRSRQNCGRTAGGARMTSPRW